VEGKAMNESTSSTIVMVLLFVLRCLIPLGILFGVSYLLRKFDFVIERSDKDLEELDEDIPSPVVTPAVPSTETNASMKKKKNVKKTSSTGKKASVAPRKKKEQTQ
jgi:hypothetical protein